MTRNVECFYLFIKATEWPWNGCTCPEAFPSTTVSLSLQGSSSGLPVDWEMECHDQYILIHVQQKKERKTHSLNTGATVNSPLQPTLYCLQEGEKVPNANTQIVWDSKCGNIDIYIIQVKQKNAAYLGGLNSSPTLRQSLLAVTYTMQIEAHSPNETSHLHWH